MHLVLHQSVKVQNKYVTWHAREIATIAIGSNKFRTIGIVLLELKRGSSIDPEATTVRHHALETDPRVRKTCSRATRFHADSKRSIDNTRLNAILKFADN